MKIPSFRKPNLGFSRIGPRLVSLIVVQTAVLVGIAFIAVSALDFARDTGARLNQSVSDGAKLVRLADGLRNGFVNELNALNLGTVKWPDANTNVQRARADFEADWSDFVKGLSAEEREFNNDVLSPYLADVREAFKSAAPLLAAKDEAGLAIFVSTQLADQVTPFLNALVATTSLQQLESEKAVAEAAASTSTLTITALSVVAIGIAFALLVGFAIYRSIITPVRKLSETVQRVSAGDLDARTELSGRDELANFGAAFDQMLSEKVSSLAQAESENERLNDSVIELLKGVAQLSQRDLTVRVAVTEDVTGPVADSLNLLTDETAKVLTKVVSTSAQLASASQEVKVKSDHAAEVAMAEQQQVNLTSEELDRASETMLRIAKLASQCNSLAADAIQTTTGAETTVSRTVTGINNIRDTIRETEKRIKRLGERSQEINAVVDLINTIAERTHILALNASMHAASAGEAGRGFAVVANEVQRLAENARQATSEIAGLVSNIQTETAGTVSTMNEAISQVVDGSRLAEDAGQRMEDTRSKTAELVAMVETIAKHCRSQAKTTRNLREMAQKIHESTSTTNQELREQIGVTDDLVKFADSLVDAVSVFKLPAPAAQVAEQTVVEASPARLAGAA